MKKINVSAPGKLMLLGEHSVVYGHPCIVTAVDQRLFCKAEFFDKKGILKIDAPDVDIVGYEKPFDEIGKGDVSKGAMFVEIAVKNFFEKHREILKQVHPDQIGIQSDKECVEDDKFGLHISTKSEFKSTFGFGSSSASTVCTIKALSGLFGIKLTNKEMFDLSYKTVLDIQKTGSGFDVASAIYGGTIYFKNKGETIIPIRHSGNPEPSFEDLRLVEGASRIEKKRSWTSQDDNFLPLVVGYSGIKADTVTFIKHVAKLGIQKPNFVETIFSHIDELVEKGKQALERGDFAMFGEIMNENQTLLEKLDVSIEKLDMMITAARNAGAYGAKLSGAGGGDCMVAIAEIRDKEKVIRSIQKAGGEILDVKANAEGVRVENS